MFFKNHFLVTKAILHNIDLQYLQTNSNQDLMPVENTQPQFLKYVDDLVQLCKDMFNVDTVYKIESAH